MKKMIAMTVVLLLFAAGTSLFCQSVQTYEVERISGRVEVGGKAAQVGQLLTGDTLVTVAPGAFVTLKHLERSVVMRESGLIIDVVPRIGSIKINRNVTIAEVDTSDRQRQTARVGTASARASDAASDLELVE